MVIARALVILSVVLVIGFIATSAVLAARSPIQRRWWWVFVCLLAAPTTAFDWGSGAIATSLFHIQLFGAGFQTHGADGPTDVNLAFPLGAVLFRHRRRRLIRQARPMLAEDDLDRIAPA
jgi:hypothetical protein